MGHVHGKTTAGRVQRAGASAFVALLASLMVIIPARAEDAAPQDPGGNEGSQPGVYRLSNSVDNLPAGRDQKTRQLWAEAMRLEADDDLIGSARVYEQVVPRAPDDSFAYWRIARNYFRYGDELPDERREEKIKYLTLGEDWAGKGLDVNPDCGECCLYRFSCMATLATIQGLWTAMRNAKEMSQLLDRGIELRPTHADNEWNTSLGNLYYAASHFYRITPEWFWLKWLIGFRGDRARALEYARSAYQIAPMRIDYNVTLAAALLCEGRENDEPALVAEGMDVLNRVDLLEDLRGYDPRFREHARTLAAHPELACEYSPDGQIDVKGEIARGRQAQEREAGAAENRTAKRRGQVNVRVR